MESAIAHPSLILTRLVNNFERKIRPELEAGNFSKAKRLIMPEALRSPYVEELGIEKLPKGAYAHYMMVVLHLCRFLDTRQSSRKDLEGSYEVVRSELHTDLFKLKMVMEGDPNYNRFYKRQGRLN